MSRPSSYEVRGRVVQRGTGQPLAGLEVRAYDRDLLYDDGLGSDRTGGDGQYRIGFSDSDFKELFEREPEVYVVVRDGGRELTRTPPHGLRPGQHEYVVDVEVERPGAGAPGGYPGGEGTSTPPRPGGDGGSTPPDGSYGGTPPSGGGGYGGGRPGDPPRPPDGPPGRPPTDGPPPDRQPPRKEPPMRPHGTHMRGYTAPHSSFYQGPFGRLFRELPGWVPPGNTDADREAALGTLAGTMLEPPGSGGDPAGDNPQIPAGYTYFGQFVDHDITFDPTSSLQRQNDPDRLHNFRTPRFDLDNLYGRGPADEPFLYDRKRPGRFLIGEGRSSNVPDADTDMCAAPRTGEADLPRNEQGSALIGDPRNDENIIVSQLQLAFLKFHNATMDFVETNEGLTGDDAFHRAQQLVRWHYQWVVLHDFLKRIVDPSLVDHLLPQGRPGYHEYCPTKFNLCFYKPEYNAYMPVEFSGAAYRLGHSMIRGRYDLNNTVRAIPIFVTPSPNTGPLDDLRGFRPLPGRWTVHWGRFLDLGDGEQVQLTRRLNTLLAGALSAIPAGPNNNNPLALLNLRRGWRLGLPSGQAVARAMGIPNPLSNADLGLPKDFVEAPLWFYILKEAELPPSDGLRLGPVGGRIVAEVFVGLAKEDPHSFLSIDPLWQPVFPKQGAQFELRDILRFAGVANNPFP